MIVLNQSLRVIGDELGITPYFVKVLLGRADVQALIEQKRRAVRELLWGGAE